MKSTKELTKETEELWGAVQQQRDWLAELQEKIQGKPTKPGGLTAEIERLKERVTALYEDDSAQEETDSLANRLTNWSESVAINADLIKSLEEKVEAQRNLLRDFWNDRAEIHRRLTALESPNRSDCPLGYKCAEGKGHWYIPTEKSFEECGESCPKVKDDKAETIRRAREVFKRAIHDWKDKGLYMTPLELSLVGEALDIASDSIKGE